eukprot:gene15671-21226_t
MADYLAWYAEIDRRGGEHYLVLLLDGDEVVAVCDASWNQLFPDRMFQRLTAVARHWRGKGLAKGVKAAMLRLVRSRHPELTLISTSNAEVNAPMLAINRQLGFAVHRQEGLYQFGTDSLRAYLATPPRMKAPQRLQALIDEGFASLTATVGEVCFRHATCGFGEAGKAFVEQGL